MGPGEMHLGDDLDAAPDEAGRIGHDSGTEGDEPVVLLMIPVDGPSGPCQDVVDGVAGRGQRYQGVGES